MHWSHLIQDRGDWEPSRAVGFEERSGEGLLTFKGAFLLVWAAKVDDFCLILKTRCNWTTFTAETSITSAPLCFEQCEMLTLLTVSLYEWESLPSDLLCWARGPQHSFDGPEAISACISAASLQSQINSMIIWYFDTVKARHVSQPDCSLPILQPHYQ